MSGAKPERAPNVTEYTDALSPKQKHIQRERASAAFHVHFTELQANKLMLVGHTRVPASTDVAECYIRYLKLLDADEMKNNEVHRRLIAASGFDFISDVLRHTVQEIAEDRSVRNMLVETQMIIGRLRILTDETWIPFRKTEKPQSDDSQIREAALKVEERIGEMLDKLSKGEHGLVKLLGHTKIIAGKLAELFPPEKKV